MCADQGSKAVKKAKAESESEDMSGSDGDFDVKPKVQVPYHKCPVIVGMVSLISSAYSVHASAQQSQHQPWSSIEQYGVPLF